MKITVICKNTEWQVQKLGEAAAVLLKNTVKAQLMKNNPGFATTAPHLKINLVNTGKY